MWRSVAIPGCFRRSLSAALRLSLAIRARSNPVSDLPFDLSEAFPRPVSARPIEASDDRPIPRSAGPPGDAPPPPPPCPLPWAAALGVVEIANAPAIRIAANNKSFFLIFRIPPKSMILNLTEERRHATNLTIGLTIGTAILARIRCSISHGIMRLCLCSGYLMRRFGKVRQTQVETALWICLSGRPKSIQSAALEVSLAA